MQVAWATRAGGSANDIEPLASIYLATSAKDESGSIKSKENWFLSIAPLFSSPCDLAGRLPALIADFLDLEISLRRRFREESVSDIVVATLLRAAGPDLSVQVPIDEKITGNDFDIIVFDPAKRSAVQFRIQAKRLGSHASNWRMGSYKELAHPHNTGTQSAALIRSSAAERRILTVPLYAFYNPARACVASGGAIGGIELADGHAVRSLVAALVKAKPKRLPYKRLSTLQSLFFPLTTLLCPGQAGAGGRIATPENALLAVRNAIEATAERRGAYAIALPGQVDVKGKSPLADDRSTLLDGELPPILAVALSARERQANLIRTKVSRPKIVLFSQ